MSNCATVIYYQEAESIKNIKFNSEPERAKYLRECKANYESVPGLLNSGGELKRRFGNDNERARSSVANDIYYYILYCINSAFQTVRNYTPITKYLCKIGEHVRSIVKALEELNMVGNDAATRVATLGEELLLYKNAMLRYVREHRSTASKNFSRGIRESSLELEDVVKRYQKEKLKIDGPFKDLKDEKKLEVYEAIIEASGRGIDATKKISRALGKMPSKALKVAGIAVFLFSAGMMVWDIFSSDHIIQAATHEAVVSVASMGGAEPGSVVSVLLHRLCS
ncbi:unnamed protein product [Camellia sinensis]